MNLTNDHHDHPLRFLLDNIIPGDCAEELARIPRYPLPDVLPWEYSGNGLHPTEKAVSVMKPLIRAFSKPGDIVLDPFCSSGSTLIAARKSGRRYIGVEKDPRVFEILRARLHDSAPEASKECDTETKREGA
ncbi:MAG: DNA methyltransferase [Burkholderiales bacterium]